MNPKATYRPYPHRFYAVQYDDVSTKVAQLSYAYITAVLNEHRGTGASGGLVSVKEGNDINPAIRFDIPGGEKLRVTPPRHLPLRVFVGSNELIMAAEESITDAKDPLSPGIGETPTGEGDTKMPAPKHPGPRMKTQRS